MPPCPRLTSDTRIHVFPAQWRLVVSMISRGTMASPSNSLPFLQRLYGTTTSNCCQFPTALAVHTSSGGTSEAEHSSCVSVVFRGLQSKTSMTKGENQQQQRGKTKDVHQTVHQKGTTAWLRCLTRKEIFSAKNTGKKKMKKNSLVSGAFVCGPGPPRLDRTPM